MNAEDYLEFRKGMESDLKYIRIVIERYGNEFKTVSNYIEKYVPLKL